MQMHSFDGYCSDVLRFSFGNSGAITNDGRLFLWGADDNKWPTFPGLCTPVPEELAISFRNVPSFIFDCAVGSKHTIALAYDRRGLRAPTEALMQLRCGLGVLEQGKG